MSKAWVLRVVPVFLVLLVACSSPSSRPTGSAGGESQQTTARPSRTLVTAVRNEPPTLASFPLGPHGSGFAVYFTKRMFNADLALLDSGGEARPYLAEELPKLGTDSWRVFDDGRMQTTYRLKPNVTWHNGAPLTSEDFVFAWRVNATAALGNANRVPFSIIDSVEAPDARTVVVNWKQPFPEADVMQSIGTGGRGLSPLPKSVLESTFEGQPPDSLVNHSFWTQEYVGLGPYKLDTWEPGVAIEASAFPGHILGAPKIPRIRVLFRADGNAVLATMMSGDLHLATDVALPLGFVPEVLKGWGEGRGTGLLHPNQWRSGVVQVRPDIVGSPALLDPRVRKALAFAVNKPEVNEAVWAGQAILADLPIAPDSELGRAANAAAVKYPFDLRQSEQQMAAAGFTKGAGGVYISPTLGRALFDIMTNASPNNEAEMTTIAGGWRQAGFEVNESVNPPALGRDNEARSTFKGIFTASTNVGDQTFHIFSGASLARADNRWVGDNRGGFVDAEYDRLAEALNTTLERPERARIVSQLARILSEQEPAISLFFAPQPWVFINELRGPKIAASDANMSWNIHEWEFN